MKKKTKQMRVSHAFPALDCHSSTYPYPHSCLCTLPRALTTFPVPIPISISQSPTVSLAFPTRISSYIRIPTPRAWHGRVPRKKQILSLLTAVGSLYYYQVKFGRLRRKKNHKGNPMTTPQPAKSRHSTKQGQTVVVIRRYRVTEPGHSQWHLLV